MVRQIDPSNSPNRIFVPRSTILDIANFWLSFPPMDVLKNNFAELLPTIKQAIDEANFIAIDTELTG